MANSLEGVVSRSADMFDFSSLNNDMSRVDDFLRYVDVNPLSEFIQQKCSVDFTSANDIVPMVQQQQQQR